MAKNIKPEIRWHPGAQQFFVDYGSLRFALTKTAASKLATALMIAVAQTDTKAGTK